MQKKIHPISGSLPLYAALLLTLSIWLYLPLPTQAATQEVQEYQIKSVFLYNLAHFVYWPKDQQPPPSSPFTIAIYGPDPFGQILDKTVAMEKKFGQPIRIKRLNSLNDLKEHINILFISSKEMDQWPLIYTHLRGRPVLTVADTENFTGARGMVSLLKQDQKIQMEINHKQVQKSGLSMSAKLLRLARIVE